MEKKTVQNICNHTRTVNE